MRFAKKISFGEKNTYYREVGQKPGSEMLLLKVNIWNHN